MSIVHCDIRIQHDDFDVAVEYQVLREQSANTGAVVIFSGLVRELEHTQNITELHLQHYPGMTEKLLAEIVSEAAQRWPLLAATVIHRVGSLKPCDQIVFVGVASRHRSEAFAAAEFIMDYLKTRATFWKRVTQSGERHWVEAKQSDRAAADLWSSHEQ